jgi:hypothetical protein
VTQKFKRKGTHVRFDPDAGSLIPVFYVPGSGDDDGILAVTKDDEELARKLNTVRTRGSNTRCK